MNASWSMTWPLAGIVYVLCAAGCAVWAITRKPNRLLWPLSGLIFSIAILNAYSEEFLKVKEVHFGYSAPILIVLFALPYRSFCLRLTERTGLRPALMKEQYSFLTLFYAGLVAVTVVFPFFAQVENRAFTLFVLIVFVCALHVPMFAFGKSKIDEFLARSGLVQSQAAPDISRSSFAGIMTILGIPLFLTLIHAVVHDDYRLFTVDAALTAIIFSLLEISKKVATKEPAREGRVAHP